MKHFMRGVLIISIAAGFPLAASGAADVSLQTVVQTVEKSYESLTDLHAEFTQKTALPAVKREERGHGELFLRKPPRGAAMFRFNYRKPNQQIISNGKTVWYNQPESNQVIVMDVASMFEGGKGIALNYLTGMGHLSRDFSIRFAKNTPDKNGNYVLELTPKKGNPTISALQLTVDAKAVERFREEGKAEAQFPVLSSVVVDPMGTRTILDFSKVKVNRGMGSDRFNFKIPAGAEVIRN